MKNQKIEKKTTFWSWLHRNRLKIVTLGFIVILPLALILTAYIGSYTANRKVYFDAELTEETETIKNFLSPDEIDAFSLDIVWNELKHPTLFADSDELTGGYYKFHISYVANENFNVKNVSIIPVLQTDWKDIRSVGTSWTIKTTETTAPNDLKSISFNHELPFKPLLFVTVSEPNLYMKVTYTVSTSGNDVNYVDYVRFSLKNVNPLNVVN
jgi:hypothetical protein